MYVTESLQDISAAAIPLEEDPHAGWATRTGVLRAVLFERQREQEKQPGRPLD